MKILKERNAQVQHEHMKIDLFCICIICHQISKYGPYFCFTMWDEDHENAQYFWADSFVYNPSIYGIKELL